MRKMKRLIWLRPVAIWTPMLAYWAGTAFNVRRYYIAILIDQNYDAYLGYVGRALVLNPLIRMAVEVSGLPLYPSIGVPMEAGQPSLGLLIKVSWEIIVLDCLAGSLFWLFVLEILVMLVYRILGRRSKALSGR